MFIEKYLQAFTHLFFPHTCAACGSDLVNNNQLLCLRCLHQLPVTGFHLLRGNPVEKIFYGRLQVAAATGYLYFTKKSALQYLVHQFKYKGRKDIGLFFGKKMGEALLESDRFTGIDGLIPLPLHVLKEKRRGYNQAAVLCDGIAAATGIPVWKNVLARAETTDTQTHKNRMERWLNMQGRFTVTDPGAIANKHILLVDDVITTGATLEACGEALLQTSGTRLSIATLAYTS